MDFQEVSEVRNEKKIDFEVCWREKVVSHSKFIYSGPPHFKIVMGRNEIHIIDEKTKNVERVIGTNTEEFHFENTGLNDLIKFDSEKFICCKNQLSVLSFSITDKEFKKEYKAGQNPCKIAKFSNDSFLVASYRDRVRLFNFETEEIMKDIYFPYNIYSNTTVIRKSISFRNLFYLNQGCSSRKILLIDMNLSTMNHLEIVSKFTDNTNNDSVENILIFQSNNNNPKKDEFLIHGASGNHESSKYMYIRNLGHEYTPGTKIEGKLVKKILISKGKTRCSVFIDQYLFIEEQCGGIIRVFQFFGNNNHSESESEMVIDKGYIETMGVLGSYSNKRFTGIEVFVDESDDESGLSVLGKLKILYGVNDGTAALICVPGIRIRKNNSVKNDLVLLDLRERIAFLDEQKEIYVFGKEKEMFISIGLRDVKLDNILRILFF